MPETITLQDGSTREVPTEEELKNLQAGHDANKEKKAALMKATKALDLKEGQTIEERIAELKEAESPDWRKLRENYKKAKAALKTKGIEVDEEGNINKEGDRVTKDEIEKMAKETTKKTLAEQERERALSQYTDEERKSVEPMLEKLEAMGGTLKENLEVINAKLFPNRKPDVAKQALNGVGGGGGAPRPSGDENSEGAKQMGTENFGLDAEELKKGGRLESI